MPSLAVHVRAARLLLLGAFAILCVHGLVWDTPTVDEFAHLPAGCYYWRTGDFSLYPGNPPLVKLAMALPALALRPDVPRGRVENTGWFPWIYGTAFMERNRAIYDRLFLAGRLPIVAFGLLLGLLVHRWARSLYGEPAALAALALYAFCPTVVAHAHLATIDVGAALLVLWTLYRFHRYLRRPSPARLLWTGLALGLALLAKLTSLLLPPLLVALAAGALLARDGTETRLRAGKLAAALAAIFLVALLVLDLGYGFQGVGTPLRSLTLYSRTVRGIAAHLPGGLPSPVPRPYLEGFDSVELINEVGEYPSYLFGRFSATGWRSYYLVSLLYKTPLPFLLALLAAPFAPLLAGRRGPRGESFLWLPIVALLAIFSLASRVDYGLRYVLPILPLGAIYASRLVPALAGLAGRGGRGRQALRLAAAALLALYPVSVLAATPDTLSYFNLLAGGRGDRILLETNYDWGQGLKRVRREMAARGLPEIGLAYFGHVDPGVYGIRWHFPRPGRPDLVAVSANFLHGYPYATYAAGRILPVPPNAFAWLARERRVADIGGGMFLYEVSPGAPAPPPP
jgi:Dolichyl-phosphate-mannose-protein mannosyltransferase